MKRLLRSIAVLGVLAMMTSGCASSRGWYHLPTAEFEEIDYQRPVQTVAVRNLEIAYLEAGRADAPVLVLVHGLGSNAKAWLRNIDDWSATHRVIALDLPGYGRSTKDDLPYSLSFYVQVITEMLDALGVEQAAIGGHSMGGQIAMLAGLQHPQRFTKLVLFAPAGLEKFTEGEGQWLAGAVTPEFVQDTTVRNIAVNLHANFYRTPPEAEFMITDRIQIRGASDFEAYCYAVSRNVGAMLDEPTSDRLDEITQPTLIVFGENDGLIPNPYLHGGRTESVAEIGVDAIADSALLMVPECGHFVQFECPDVVNPAVAAFLSR